MKHIKLTIGKLAAGTLMVSALSLSGCGGGGAGGGLFGASGKTIGGVAVDGYLQYATVFLDANRNGVADAGVPTTTTDATGRYTLDYSAWSGSITGLRIVVTGGVDSDTGFPFAGQLSAPIEKASQAQVVTPLTTLVDAMVSQGLATDVNSAKQQVAQTLGLTTDQLSTDPVAALASHPGIYTTGVALQRAVQMLASANAQSGEQAHESQERVIHALARAIRAQTSTVDVSQLVSGLSLQNAPQAQVLASTITQSVQTGLDSSGHEGAKVALKAMDEVRTRMESDRDYRVATAATKIDTERGKTSSRPYYELTQNSRSQTALNNLKGVTGTTGTTLLQPVNTSGRLLASNCFQCHGTGGTRGFDNIRGKDATDIRDYLNRPANGSIMAAHVQGYTTAQLNAIIAYLQQ